MTAREQLWDMARKAAEAAWLEMMQVQRFDMYLYFKPGELKGFYDDAPEGWTLTRAERIPCNMDKEHLARWIEDKCRSVPCLRVA